MATKQTFTAGQVLTAAQLTTLQAYVGIVQAQSTILTTTVTNSSGSTTLTGVTGLSVAITPTSASNKVLIIASVSFGAGDGGRINFGLTGGNSATAYLGATAGSRTRVGTGQTASTSNNINNVCIAFLDSPATTSATTYQVTACGLAGETFYINRSSTDTDNANHGRGASTITVFEVTP
jgi:hypothetical protein